MRAPEKLIHIEQAAARFTPTRLIHTCAPLPLYMPDFGESVRFSFVDSTIY